MNIGDAHSIKKYIHIFFLSNIINICNYTKKNFWYVMEFKNEKESILNKNPNIFLIYYLLFLIKIKK